MRSWIAKKPKNKAQKKPETKGKEKNIWSVSMILWKRCLIWYATPTTHTYTNSEKNDS